MDSNQSSSCRRTFAVAAAVLVTVAGAAGAAEEHVKTLVSFSGQPDASLPSAGPVIGPDGNLYGTSYYGGTAGLGTVYKVTPKGDETILYSFMGGSDGSYPAAPLIVGQDGSLYGTTEYGGGGACTDDQGSGCGTVFRITLQGAESLVYAFQGGDDGWVPTASVTQVASGDLYGTTNAGGAYNSGTIFHITPGGAEEIIHTFNYNVDGGAPGPLITGNDGNFYVLEGYFLGALLRVTPAGDVTTVYTFGQTSSDPAFPNGILVKDADGNFYGTAPYGGTSGLGAVFEVTPAGVEQTLHSFAGNTDGSRPNGPVLLAKNGLLYGTTQYGGLKNNGIIYALSEAGTETVLHSFKNCVYNSVQGNGLGLVEGKHKHLYGATTGGCGTPPDTFGSVIRIEAGD